MYRWLRNGKEEYVLLFHDDPEWSLVATSEQGIMAVLWRSWAEFQENDSDICIFANVLGFKRIVLKLYKNGKPIMTSFKNGC